MSIQFKLDYIRLAQNNTPDNMRKIRKSFPEICHYELYEKSYARKENDYANHL